MGVKLTTLSCASFNFEVVWIFLSIRGLVIHVYHIYCTPDCVLINGPNDFRLLYDGRLCRSLKCLFPLYIQH